MDGGLCSWWCTEHCHMLAFGFFCEVGWRLSVEKGDGWLQVERNRDALGFYSDPAWLAKAMRL
jgi:hypothetical protein